VQVDQAAFVGRQPIVDQNLNPIAEMPKSKSGKTMLEQLLRKKYSHKFGINRSKIVISV
jgi:hypothetical protein